jgi:ABC-type multidrug transport system permease subunit
VLNKNATSGCEYCSLTVADQFLASDQIYYSQRWRNFGIVLAFIAFNIFMATLLFYFFRVKRWDLDGVKKFAHFAPSGASKTNQ